MKRARPTPLPWLSDAYSGYQEKLGIAQLFTDVCRQPIQPQRWRAIESRVLRELSRRAREHGTTPEQEMYLVAKTALACALLQVNLRFSGAEPDPDSIKGFAREIRRRVNDLATEALLGVNWRQLIPPADLQPESYQDSHTRADLAAVIDNPQLTTAQKEYLQALRETETGIDHHAACRQLGITFNAGMQRWKRIVAILRSK
jgi:hypothetical protein